MRKILLTSSVLASLALILPALALAAPPFSEKASNLSTSAITSPIAPALPSPNLGPNATTAQYLSAAQSALAAGKTGLAQESLENAETLALTRSVPYTTSGKVRDESSLVKTIQAALHALGRNDIATAQHYTGLAAKEAS